MQIAFFDIVFSFLLGNTVPPDKAASQVASPVGAASPCREVPVVVARMPTDATLALSFIAGFLLVPKNVAQLFQGPGIWDSPWMGLSIHMLATRSEMTREGAPTQGMPRPAEPHGRSAGAAERTASGIRKFAVLQSQMERTTTKKSA